MRAAEQNPPVQKEKVTTFMKVVHYGLKMGFAPQFSYGKGNKLKGMEEEGWSSMRRGR